MARGSSTQALVQRVLNARTLCEALGVRSDATQSEMRKVYRRTCLLLHPDKCKVSCASDCSPLIATYLPRTTAGSHQCLDRAAGRQDAQTRDPKQATEAFQRLGTYYGARHGTLQNFNA